MNGLWALMHSPPGIIAEILVGLAAAMWRATTIADQDAPLAGRLAVGAIVGTLGFAATTTAIVIITVGLGRITGWA
jgi:hypothetical protein